MRKEGGDSLAPQVDALRRIVNLKSRHFDISFVRFSVVSLSHSRTTKRTYRRSAISVPLLSRKGRPRLPNENTQRRNRDIKIMKQIPREIGGAGAGTMRTSIELYATSLHR